MQFVCNNKDMKILSKNTKRCAQMALLCLLFVLLAVFLFACDKPEPAPNESNNLVKSCLALGVDTDDFKIQDMTYIPPSENGTNLQNVFLGENQKIYFLSCPKESAEYGTVYLAVLAKDNIITALSGVDIYEPHDNCIECFDEPWLSNFVGIDVTTRPALVGASKPVGNYDVFYFSGATETSKAIINCLNKIFEYEQGKPRE